MSPQPSSYGGASLAWIYSTSQNNTCVICCTFNRPDFLNIFLGTPELVVSVQILVSFLSVYFFSLIIFPSSLVLSAIDARERQHWVNRLRATAEHYAECTSVVSQCTYLLRIFFLPGLFTVYARIRKHFASRKIFEDGHCRGMKMYTSHV